MTNNINCCVYGCHSKKGREKHLSFHHFPKKNSGDVSITNKLGVEERVDRLKAWEIKLLMGKPTTFYMKATTLWLRPMHVTIKCIVATVSDCDVHQLISCRSFSGKTRFDRKLPRLKKCSVPSQNLPKKSISQMPKFRPQPRVRMHQKLVEERQIQTAYEFGEQSMKNDEPSEQRTVCLSQLEKIAVDGLMKLSKVPVCEKSEKATQVKSGDIFVPFIANVDDESKLSSLTGIPSFKLLESLVQLMTEYFPDKRVNKLSIKERVMLTFIKMKTGLRYVVLAVVFQCVTSKTCKIIFEDTIAKLAIVLKPVIDWPSLDECRRNQPTCFNKFTNVRVVLDCTEFVIQKPKSLYLRIMTYSHYKGGHTVKFMTGVSPAGLITFISDAYGGKASDNAIFEQSGIIDKLEAGRDAIMVDKGFRIDNITDTHFIKLIRPPYLKQNKQLTEYEAKQNIDIARARVHIERTNQRIEVFEIFTKPFPASLACMVDDIFLVACAIVNLTQPILSDDKFL